jgi:hypothetical protein
LRIVNAMPLTLRGGMMPTTRLAEGSARPSEVGLSAKFSDHVFD